MVWASTYISVDARRYSETGTWQTFTSRYLPKGLLGGVEFTKGLQELQQCLQSGSGLVYWVFALSVWSSFNLCVFIPYPHHYKAVLIGLSGIKYGHGI
jgi:hypothetical protein